MLMNSFQFGIICDDLVMNSVLETKSQVMHFPPNDFIQKILRQFSRARLRNKNWNTICNHVSFWVRSNFFWQGSQGISNSDRQKNTITTLHILYCICALHVHHVTVKKLPTLPRSALRRMCSGHLLTSRAQGDVWYTNYSVWTEPWKPGLKFNLCICNFVFFVTILFKGYCMPMFTTFARQNKDWQWLKYVCYLYFTLCYIFWAANPFQQDTRG